VIISTELFVLVVFVLAFPIVIMLFKSADLPGDKYFLAAFCFLLVSNIATVVEEFYLPKFFDILENGSIAISSFFFLLAIHKLIRHQTRSNL